MANLRLKELRKTKLQLTQTEFANIFDIPQTTYSGYENGFSEPPLDFLIKVADKFGLTLDYLCGRKTEKLALNEFFSINKNKVIEKITELSDDDVAILDAYVDGLIDKNKQNNK